METKEFKSFFKKVDGNEGSKCHYPTRLDTYGCGCSHNCSYCYAKSLLNFRKLWNPDNPSVADLKKIERVVRKLNKGDILRLGGMTDCFQPIEQQYRVTLNTIRILNEYGIGYLIVTKSALVAHDDYINAMRKDLAHIQISLTHTKDFDERIDEGNASQPSARIKAIEKLQSLGFDVQVRLSPYIPEFIDLDIVNAIRCDKTLVEFLRVNTWIKRWFDIDYSDYIVRQGNYLHLPLEKKIELMKGIKFKEVSVCEDEDRAYEYWKNLFGREDCCNLR